MRDIERETAEALLGRGKRYRVPSPRWLRLFGVHHLSVVITPLKLGTELEISRLTPTYTNPSQEGDKTDDVAFFVEHIETFLQMVSVATLNDKWKIKYMTRWRMRHLRRLPLLHLYELWLSIQQMSGLKDFSTIIRLATQTKRTRPNLSQTAEGS